MKNPKLFYETPLATALQFESDQILCASGAEVGSSVENYSTGSTYDGDWK